MKNCGEELHHSLEFSIYSDFPFTNYVVYFQETIDHLFYETNSFEMANVVPIPPLEKVIEFTALPSKYMPSDHIAIIFDLKIK